MIEDIEKHCRSKRLKKNIYKMDMRTGMSGAKIDNSALTMAASDPSKLTGNSADPVIAWQFK